MEQTVQETLEALAFWPHLTAEQQQTLLLAAQTRRFAAGAAVRAAGEACLGLMLLRSGVLRVYLLSEDGREATIYRLRAGDTCVLSASCLLQAITFDVEIDAESDCEVVLLPALPFARLMDENIYVENYVYQQSAARLSDVISAVERMFFLTLRQRIAAFLIDETAQAGGDTLALTQEQLARAIGSAREAVSRTLRQLAQEGAVAVTRGAIQVTDKAALYRELG